MTSAAEQTFGPRFESISRYVDLLTSRGIEWGLLGPREADRVWDRHILNSVAMESLIPSGHVVADVGSGAGLPGVPLAILRPDLQVTCIEPLLRRANFLELVVDELGLAPQVTVVRARAEDLAGSGTPRYDTVTSRALAPIGRLLDWCWPLATRRGQVVAIKGRSAADEVARDQGALIKRRLHAAVRTCPVPGSDEPTYAVVVSATS